MQRPCSKLGVGLCLAFGLAACGATEGSPKASADDAGASSGAAGIAAHAGASGNGGGMAGTASTITDGSERCKDLRASGTFAGSSLPGSNGWTSFGVWTEETPWRGSFSWQGTALELRGPAGVAATAYVEGSHLTAAYGYMLRTAAMPWKAACLTSASTVSMLNANDVLGLELSAAAACSGQPGTGTLDLCFAAPIYSSGDPEPPCARGVRGMLEGEAAPPEISSLIASSGETGASSVTFGRYTVRLPLASWSFDSTNERDFSGGLVAVERADGFDLYCAASGHTQSHQILLDGISKLVSCDASAAAVESAQVCRWDFTRER